MVQYMLQREKNNATAKNECMIRNDVEFDLQN